MDVLEVMCLKVGEWWTRQAYLATALQQQLVLVRKNSDNALCFMLGQAGISKSTN